VGIAGGKEKEDALLAVLRAGYINVLVTDNRTAGALIAHAEAPAGKDTE
jgi:DNA-binding transcriptional regulator LsrR (DeoR family)